MPASNPRTPIVRFRHDFLWGAASCGYQVGGGPGSNWDVWERSKARRDVLLALGVPEDKISEFICGNACEFNTRFRGDMQMAKNFGHNSMRIGIEWSGVEPRPGEYDTAVLENYRQMCEFARSIGIKLVVTFYHWTHRNGFEWFQEDAVERFAKYVEVTLPYLGDIEYFTILNEPNVYAHFSYRWGLWPPCIADEQTYQRVNEALIKAHRLAHDIIKKRLPGAAIGIGQSFGWVTSDDAAFKEEKDRWQYDFLDAIQDKLDFVGIQLYMHNHFCTDSSKDKPGWLGNDACADHPVLSDVFGPYGGDKERWGMCPQATYRVVVEAWHRYKLPIMITEHGHAVPEMDDQRRCWYLWESLRWLENSFENGIPLIGYLHWSIMDNFEWKFGFGPRFGLWHVDRQTQVRTPRTSAYLLRDIIKSCGRTEEIEQRYRRVIAHPHMAHAA